MRSNAMRNCSLFLLSAAVLSTAACGAGKVVVVPPATTPAPSALIEPAPGPVIVTTVPAMPAPPQDLAIGVSPGADYVWVKGYYNWSGDHYVWVPGGWMQTPRPAAVWVPGQWQPTSGGYAWVAGHWQ